MEDKDVSPMISMYRHNFTVATLERVQRVTGKCYAIDGDLWLQSRYYKERP
jgi:CTP:phosphocholine cytidylyltransferase-like protein